MNSDTKRQEVKVGTGWRDKDWREHGKRVVFVTRLDGDYAYVRGESSDKVERHRRARVRIDRLTRRFTFVGEMGDDPSIWPDWFREDAQGA